MATDFSVNLDTLITISGNVNVKQARVGRTVTLRISPYVADAFTAVETPANSGNYLFTTIPDNTYQLWVDGSVFPGFGTFQINDEFPVVRSNIAMGSFKLTGLAAGTVAGESVRYEQVVRTSGSQAISTVLQFQNTIPEIVSTTNGIPNPSVDGHLIHLKFFNSQLGSFTGVVQSTHFIKCLPTRTVNDTYSRQTLESCVDYLQSVISGSQRGVILLEPTGASLNGITPAAADWLADSIDITSFNKAKILLTDTGGTSLTANTLLTNIYLQVEQGGALTLANLQFENCIIEMLNTKSLTLQSCKFSGLNKISMPGILSLTNCTGAALATNKKEEGGGIVYTGTKPFIVYEDIANLGI